MQKVWTQVGAKCRELQWASLDSAACGHQKMYTILSHGLLTPRQLYRWVFTRATHLLLRQAQSAKQKWEERDIKSKDNNNNNNNNNLLGEAKVEDTKQ